MIKINELDPTKTYIGWNVGTGLISGLIKRCSGQDTKLLEKHIATHVFAIVFEDNKPVVFEYHAKWKGGRKLPYDEWLKDYDPEQVFCHEFELNLNALYYYVDFNAGYSLADISRLGLEALTEKHIFNNNPGMVCSEYIASCLKDVFCICYKYDLPAYRIKPVHFQNLFI